MRDVRVTISENVRTSTFTILHQYKTTKKMGGDKLLPNSTILLNKFTFSNFLSEKRKFLDHHNHEFYLFATLP